ncbi:hypothetical protein PMAYCL1PPCAC_17656, partial [Pristionchus mayeri]
ENRRVMNQSGSYHVENNGKGGNSAVPSSGKTGNIGYICAFKDNMGCPDDQTRFRNKCYKTQDNAMSFNDAVAKCAVRTGKGSIGEGSSLQLAQGSLPKIEDDDLNQFLAGENLQEMVVHIRR